MDKKIISICLLTFAIGCIGGGALAYANHQKGIESQNLLASIAQTQDNWEVEQFIREQEEQRPDGMEEAQVVTGSRYSGITYNNVSVASATDTNAQREVNAEIQSSDVQSNEKMVGRVAIQSGSLNIRSIGSIDGTVIGQAYKDELLEIIHQDGVWYQVVTADGVQGYVSSTYVEMINE